MVVKGPDLWIPRIEGEKNEFSKPMHPDCFTVKIYHGGCIRHGAYVGGSIDFYDDVDKDMMSLIEVHNMVRQLSPAYTHQIDYWYRVGDESGKMVKLESDIDVLIMCTPLPPPAPPLRLVIIYLDHMEVKSVFEDDDIFSYEDYLLSQPRSTGVVIEGLPVEEIHDVIDVPQALRNKGIMIREPDQDHVPTQRSNVGSVDPKDKGKQKLYECSSGTLNGLGHSSGDGQSTGVLDGTNVNLGSSSYVLDEDSLRDIYIEDDKLDCGGYEEDYGTEEEDDEAEDDGYDPQADDDDYDQYGVDDEVDVRLQEEEDARVGALSVVETQSLTVQEEEREVVDEEDMFGYMDSDDEMLGYRINSDGEREEVGLEFNPKTDMKKPVFRLRMMFATVQILRDALTEHAIQGGWEYTYIKNDKQRVRVLCKEDDCPFFLFASKMQHENTVIIKGYEPKHKCTRKFNNCMVKQKYLTNKFKAQIALNDSWKPESLAKKMTSEIRAKVSKSMAYRAKVAALLEVQGSINEQYARIHDYGRELQRVDPGTTIDIKCSFPRSSKFPVFKRMYICLEALKNGCKAGCRHVIGLDGAFLKGPFGGCLLSAVVIDANNCTYVVAYAMVELENKDSWIWFLELLANDLNVEQEGAGWVFISDKQKGLMSAFGLVVPRADIRFCVQHMWTNFTKLFPGKVMKDQMWKCAKSTTMPYYLKEMEEMKSLDPDAYDWMTANERPPRHWCRAFFSTGVDCDIMINNISESWNACIVDFRGKPPVSMFEDIRIKLMKWVALRRTKMEAYHGNICPKPRKIIEKNKVKAAEDCTATFNGGDIAEVENIEGSKNVVNLVMRTCTCRMWDLTGIPCKHAISAIYLKRQDPDEYVAPCYLKKTYMSIYSNLVQPANSMDMWSTSDVPPILPPQYTRQPGRPKSNKRIKDASEKLKNGTGKLGRVQRSLTCSNCKQEGHNIKTCKSHLPPKEKQTPKKRNAGGSENQSKKSKTGPKTANELRKKVRERAEYQRKKFAAKKVADLAGNRSTPTTLGSQQATNASTSSRTQNPSASTSSRPPQPQRPSNKKDETLTRVSQRVRKPSGKIVGK